MFSQPNMFLTMASRIVVSAVAIAPFTAHLASAVPIYDGNVPYLMDGAGTEADQARYIIGENGAYNVDFGDSGIAVGLHNSWNNLLVRNGSILSVNEGMWIGMNYGSNHNTAIVDASTLRANSMEIGQSGNNNSLFVRNGGTVQVVAGNMRLGTFENPMNPVPAGGDGNQVVVSGQGSSLAVAGVLDVGVYGSNNLLVVEQGARAETGFGLLIGATIGGDTMMPTADNNRVLVTGSDSVLEVNGSNGNGVFVGAGAGSGNALHVADGGAVRVEGEIAVGNSGGVNNEIVVKGANSSLSAERLMMGASSYSGAGAPRATSTELRIEDGGIVHVRDSMTIGNNFGGDHLVTVAGRDSILQVDAMLVLSANDPNAQYDGGMAALLVANGGLVKTDLLLLEGAYYQQGQVYLAGGYIAWAGDNMDGLMQLLLNGAIQVWNPEMGVWENALGSAYFASGYFDSDEAAKAFTGYDDLGGYTILTSMVPEPSTYALVLGGALVVITLMRRRRA